MIIEILFLSFVAASVLLCLRLVTFIKKCSRDDAVYRHFAEEKDVEKIGLFSGTKFRIGYFFGKKIRLTDSYPLLLLGKIGTKKTSAVVVPNILESKKSHMFIVDEKGSVARYTARYRNSLGKTTIFDWDLLDNKDMFAKWNPMDEQNLPQDEVFRQKYIQCMVKGLFYNTNINQDKEDIYWQTMAENVLTGIMFFNIQRVKQACANDYFLEKLIKDLPLSENDKQILNSYYQNMPERYVAKIKKQIKTHSITIKNYVPIGSWAGIKEAWRGRELSLPMIADTLYQDYYDAEADNEAKIVQNILYRYMEEANLFAYDFDYRKYFAEVFNMSELQSKVLFGKILQALAVFKQQSIRERLSDNDYCMADMSKKSDEKITVYNITKSKNAKIIGRIFTDLQMMYCIYARGEQDQSSVFVLDDVVLLPKLNFLTEALMRGQYYGMRFLLSVRDLRLLYYLYGKDDVESIVANTPHKLLFGENAEDILSNLNGLTKFGTKSIQVQKTEILSLLKNKKALNDSAYYKRVAWYFEKIIKKNVWNAEKFLFMHSQYYHLPILCDKRSFIKDEYLYEKSLGEFMCQVDYETVKNRKEKSLTVPCFEYKTEKTKQKPK